MISRTKKRLFFLVYGSIILFLSVIVSFAIVSIARPAESPWPSMLRSEADLRALKTAIETYQAEYAAYPPPGPEGLGMAMAFLSRNVQYHAGGAPADGWGHAFRYVPAYAYAEEGSPALQGDDGFFAPDTYQLYSPGMDGNPGFEETLKQRDNITSWDGDRSWRALYSERQKKYFMEKGRRQ